ncbi:hypothetical protein H5410_004870 [Solanum commersonii]|uniref:Secreted protein n=1 Tax=Solanum commersonii TaxID=4109 RepID=A0A9J6A619_SOLCO|nr:hypothetical protein H5410_004870 [Solanum commersonii]
MQCGIILHHAFWLLLPPLLIQQLNKFAVCSGMVQFDFVRLRKMAQICVVKLQCKNRCWLVSVVFPHSEHQDTIILPFLLSTSCVRQALLATNHVKHFILVGAKGSPYLSPQTLLRVALLGTFHFVCPANHENPIFTMFPSQRIKSIGDAREFF